MWNTRVVRRSVTLGMAATVLASSVGVMVFPSASVAQECLDAVWTEEAAQQMALDCDIRVEVESLRGESTTVMADPSGEFIWRETFESERVKLANGEWVDTDPTLVETDTGAVIPAATTINMWLPSEGTEPTIMARFGDSQLALTLDVGSTDPLPAPTLDGPVATYADVSPGVDLQITADSDGFSHTLVVHTPEAAASPAIRHMRIDFTVTGAEVIEADGETIEVIDPDTGAVLLSTGSAMMWDSSAEPADAAQTNDAGESARIAQMPVEVNGDNLVLTPSSDFLDDPTTQYPVYLDPTWTSKDSAYATLTDNEGSVYNQPHPPVDYNRGAWKVGYTDDWKVFRARTLLRMPLSGIKGNKIVSKATFSVTQGWSWAACGGSQATGLYQIPKFTSSTTWGTSWNASGSGWQTRLDTNNGVFKYGHDCAPRDVEWDATKAVKDAVGDSYVYLGLKAENESNHDGWKKYQRDAELLIHYNTPPTKPTEVSVAGKDCVSGSDRPLTSDATPPIRARVFDADGDTLTAEAYWTPQGESWPTSPSLTQGSLKSKNYLVKSPDTALADGVYSLRVRAKDSKTSSPYASCEFEVDTVAPGAPTLMSSDYPSEDDSKDGSGAIGETGQFVISAPSQADDIDSYVVTLNDEELVAGRSVAVHPSQTTIMVTPTRGAENTLRVWSKDRAGNVSPNPAVYRFVVNKVYTEPVAHWSFDQRDGEVVIDDSGNGQSLSPVGTPTIVDGRLLVDDGAAMGLDNGYHSEGPVIDPTSSFTISAWAQLESRSGDQTIVSIAAGNRPAVYLKYKPGNDKWWFSLPNTDTATPTYTTVASTDAPVLGKWTHLVAGYDSGTDEVFLYVDGQLQGTADRGGKFSTQGRAWVGQAADTNDEIWSPWEGQLDEIRLYDRVVVATEAAVYAEQAVQTGHWSLDDEGGDTSSDISGYSNALSLGDGTNPSDDGSATEFNGQACASTETAILNTSSSFSVAAWAYLTDKVDSRNLITQPGVNRPAFELKYQVDLDRWVFSMSTADETSAVTNVTARSTEVAQLNAWTHLAATYDAGTGTMQLFVNGQLTDTRTIDATWHASGPLQIGCAARNLGANTYYPWAGVIDDVQVFSGVLGGGDDQIVDSPNPSTIMAMAGRMPGDLPGRDAASDQVFISYDGGGRASISTVAPDDSGQWQESTLWISPTSDFYPFYTNMVLADVNGDGQDDVVLLREVHVYDKLPTWSNSVIAQRTVTLTVLIRDEFGLTAQQPVNMDTTSNTPENLTAPIGPWFPSGTYWNSGDIDADGDDDLIATPDGRECSGALRVFEADQGTLNDPVTSVSDGSIDWCLASNPELAVTDMNGDGADDIAVFATAESGVGARVATYRSNGSGKIADPEMVWSTSNATWNSGLLAVMSGSVNAATDDPRRHPDTGQTGVGFGDFVALRQLTGDGTWTASAFMAEPFTTELAAPITIATPTEPTRFVKASPALVDVDADGDDDLVILYIDTSGVSVWLYRNDGGAFAAEELVWTRTDL